jgi:FAD/FMN-containing dehydrogenase
MSIIVSVSDELTSAQKMMHEMMHTIIVIVDKGKTGKYYINLNKDEYDEDYHGYYDSKWDKFRAISRDYI